MAYDLCKVNSRGKPVQVEKKNKKKILKKGGWLSTVQIPMSKPVHRKEVILKQRERERNRIKYGNQIKLNLCALWSSVSE